MPAICTSSRPATTQVERATTTGALPTYRIKLSGGRAACATQQLGAYDCSFAAPLLSNNATDPQWFITPSTTKCS